jgi:hypothetical protein
MIKFDIDIDILAKLDEDILHRHAQKLKHRLRKVKSYNERMKLETEFCYYYRELEMRYVRRQAHIRYLTGRGRAYHNTPGVA